jgi:hypothetical protein
MCAILPTGRRDSHHPRLSDRVGDGPPGGRTSGGLRWRSGHRARIGCMLDAKTLLRGSNDDPSDIEGQHEDARRGARTIGLTTQESAARFDRPFKYFEPRLFGHASSLH